MIIPGKISSEMFASRRFSECSFRARLLFIGFLTFMNHGGHHICSTRALSKRVFPRDHMTPDELRGLVEELMRAGLIEIKISKGHKYFALSDGGKSLAVTEAADER